MGTKNFSLENALIRALRAELSARMNTRVFMMHLWRDQPRSLLDKGQHLFLVGVGHGIEFRLVIANLPATSFAISEPFHTDSRLVPRLRIQAGIAPGQNTPDRTDFTLRVYLPTIKQEVIQGVIVSKKNDNYGLQITFCDHKELAA